MGERDICPLTLSNDSACSMRLLKQCQLFCWCRLDQPFVRLPSLGEEIRFSGRGLHWFHPLPGLLLSHSTLVPAQKHLLHHAAWDRSTAPTEWHMPLSLCSLLPGWSICALTDVNKTHCQCWGCSRAPQDWTAHFSVNKFSC